VNPEMITWKGASAEDIANSPDSKSTPGNPSNASNPATATAASSNESSLNKTTIIGLSVGLGTIGIISIALASVLIHRRMKKNKNAATELDPRDRLDTDVLEIPSSDDKYHPTMKQPSPVNKENL
jgi:hypothetical protein